tara:strand:- start:92 stop:1336 length:1245 start_codon:yes stop_codon:yes gene_type:complete
MKSKKNIIIISCVAPPETGVSGRVNWDIAEHEATKGNNVTFISPRPSRPLGKFNDLQIKYEQISVDGIKKVYVKSFIYPSNGLFGRLRESFSFGYNAVNYINKNKLKSDFIYCMPWPFIGQLIFLILLKDKKTKVIMNIQDLYPESFLMKIKPNFLKLFFNFFKLIDRYIAYKSYHLSVVSQSLKDFYINERNVKSEKISVIENWQNENEFIDLKLGSKEELKEKYNLNFLENQFVFMYLGNIGPVAGVEDVINDFKEISNNDISLIIAGSGTSKNDCVELVHKQKIKNIHFVNVAQGLKSVVELQSIADVLILPIKPGSSASSIPSKLIAYMFSSKPIISSADKNSFTADVIINSNSGWLLYDFGNWINVMEMVSKLPSNEILEMGKNGFKFSINNFSKSEGLKKINNLFNRL